MLLQSMIASIGVDIVQISRIHKLYLRYGDRFLKKAFHGKEINAFKQKQSQNVDQSIRFLAGRCCSLQEIKMHQTKRKKKFRWAAKEATYKALKSNSPLSNEDQRIPFPQILVSNRQNGSPQILFEDEVERIAQSLKVNQKQISLSISHEQDYAVAFVVLQSNLDG